MAENIIEIECKKSVNYAIKLLSYREYSIKSISTKLRSKGYSEDLILKTIDYLLSNEWLSNERFCDSFIRSKVTKGQGYLRICYELGLHGISKEFVKRAVELNNIDWQSVCDRVCKKKYSTLKLDDRLKTRIKLERFLQQRGFSIEQIRYSIQKVQSKQE